MPLGARYFGSRHMGPPNLSTVKQVAKQTLYKTWMKPETHTQEGHWLGFDVSRNKRRV